MFDVTSDEINQLNDVDLRELVARLCEAELSSQGLSPVAVTWGGNQTAPDGGLDVRIELPVGNTLKQDGFIPRNTTGFQVKMSDMAPSDITEEMKPKGSIRQVISDLAEKKGAYIIVSSGSNTADRPLQSRKKAIRNALDTLANADELFTDFYDRRRIASWVGLYPGLVSWVKELLGRSLDGWCSYDAWIGKHNSKNIEYLLDNQLCLHFNEYLNTNPTSTVEAIDKLRNMLREPGKSVRLVGLSGVGKTRLAQTLFDKKIGVNPLDPSLAVYTDLSDNPTPQPSTMARDLIATNKKAVLIIDNCSSDLHQKLTELCKQQRSPISVLTIEYDVREDQPEGTEVVNLEPSSTELIEELLKRRIPILSQVNRHTIAEAAGGNARIAIAIAETVEETDSVAGLSNVQLFKRLFLQRNVQTDDLLQVAQACSLVYSFQAKSILGENPEIERLAALANKDIPTTYRCISQLLNRDLVQSRGVWRAVLPHAIANWLASRALQETPPEIIEQHFFQLGCERLARSFSKRLSFLHKNPVATDIVRNWLSPNGKLGEVAKLDENQQVMFQNVAPVLPEAALEALERANISFNNTNLTRWIFPLLRSLAYDADLFERSTQILIRFATGSKNTEVAKKASDVFLSLFTIYLSGTNASLELRIQVIKQLLSLPDTSSKDLGLNALNKALQTSSFFSGYRFEFGARSRDYGYAPKSQNDVHIWYKSVLEVIENFSQQDRDIKLKMRGLLGMHFSGLWEIGSLRVLLVKLALEINSNGFWRECDEACRLILKFDKAKLSKDELLQVSDLAQRLKPSNLADEIRALLLGNSLGELDYLKHEEVENSRNKAINDFEEVAKKHGVEVATDGNLFAELLPDLFRGHDLVYDFGWGLVSGSKNRILTWESLLEAHEKFACEQSNIQVLRGFLANLWNQDNELAQQFLDKALTYPNLNNVLHSLYSAVPLDERGIKRLKNILDKGAPAFDFSNFAYQKGISSLPISHLKDLLNLFNEHKNGFEIAISILEGCFMTYQREQKNVQELIIVGQEFLDYSTIRIKNYDSDFKLTEVIKWCLADISSIPLVSNIVKRISQSVENCETSPINYNNSIKELLSLHPNIVLDALFDGTQDEQKAGINLLNLQYDENFRNPLDVIDCKTLIAWCEQDKFRNYTLAASFITYSNVSSNVTWSEQAKVLLKNAPDPKKVLQALIDRFMQRNHFSGSLASLVEKDACLLNDIKPYIPEHLMPFVIESKRLLTIWIADRRRLEVERHRKQDSGFE